MSSKLTTEMVADHLYVQLRTTFPGARFFVDVAPDSVVIDVSWVDGPEESEVQDVTEALTSDAGEITIDLRGREVAGHSAVQAVFLDRFFAYETLVEARRLWTEQTGVEVDAQAGWGAKRPEITVLGRIIPADLLGNQITRIASIVVERRAQPGQ